MNIADLALLLLTAENQASNKRITGSDFNGASDVRDLVYNAAHFVRPLSGQAMNYLVEHNQYDPNLILDRIKNNVGDRTLNNFSSDFLQNVNPQETNLNKFTKYTNDDMLKMNDKGARNMFNALEVFRDPNFIPGASNSKQSSTLVDPFRTDLTLKTLYDEKMTNPKNSGSRASDSLEELAKARLGDAAYSSDYANEEGVVSPEDEWQKEMKIKEFLKGLGF